MAMAAADGTFEQASIVNGGGDNCRSTTAWGEHQSLPTEDSGSMEGSGGGGDYSSTAAATAAVRMEWDLKTTNPCWEWENITTMVYPVRQGGGDGEEDSRHVVTKLQAFDWAHVVCSSNVGSSVTTTSSSSPLALKSSDVSMGLASSGTSTPSGVSSVSSGVPGLAMNRGNAASHNTELSSVIKSETVELTTASRRTPESPIEHQQRPFVGFLGVQSCEHGEPENSASENGGEDKKLLDGNQSAAAPSSKQKGAFTGLKLGRQTYFKDSAAGVTAAGGVVQVVRERAAASAGPICSPPPGKKRQQARSPGGIQIPCCQVEGCKTDLTPAKDYHRRHKVCEMHSKAPRCIAGGQEQRFCQQCSRFHVLTEFDGGKRSCRRRLAGHNRRRRKAHPETHTTLSIKGLSPVPSDNSLTMEDNKQSIFLQHHRGSTSSSTSVDTNEYAGPLANSLKLSPWSGLGRSDDCKLAASVESQSILSTLLRPTADHLLMLSQSPKGRIAAPKSSAPEMAISPHQFMEGALSPLGQGLSLSSSSAGLLGGFEPIHLGACSQGAYSVSAVDSGCALSLLSSQAWVSHSSSCPPIQGIPLGLPQADTTLEQFMAGSNDSNYHGPSFSHHSQLQPLGRSQTAQQQQHCSVVEKLLPLYSRGLGSMETNYGHAGSGNQTIESNVNNDGGQQHNNFLSGLGVYAGAHSMHTLLQTRHFGGLSSGTKANAHPTMDLMQALSTQVQSLTNGSQGGGHSQSQPSSNGHNGEFSPLHPFRGSMYSSQQML